MKKIALTFCMIIALAAPAHALDWKALHEQSDTMDSAAARRMPHTKKTSFSYQYRLGLVYLNEHKDKEAGRIFDRLARLDSKEISFQWGKAEALRRSHQFKESKKILEGIIQTDKGFAPAFISLAYIQYNETDFNGSMRLAYHVAELGKEKVDTSNLARAYLLIAGNKGMIAHNGGPISKIINGPEVMSYLKKAAALQPDSPAVLFGYGSFYLLAPKIAGGNIEKAAEYLNKAVERDPLFADAYARLAQVCQVKGDAGSYEYFIAKALKIEPDNILALDIKTKRCKFICVEK